MALPRLEVDSLICGYGERALFDALSFALDSGEAARILGANGSGKTTLLRTVAGLYRPLTGAARWCAAPAADGEAPILHEQICFIGHDNALNGALTPLENLDLLMRVAGRRVSSRDIRSTLSNLGLKHIARKACERLSAGQRRRVSLARLWLSDAPLWLLDEPAAALDVDARTVLCDRIAQHVLKGGQVLFTTHERLPLPGVSIRDVELAPC